MEEFQFVIVNFEKSVTNSTPIGAHLPKFQGWGRNCAVMLRRRNNSSGHLNIKVYKPVAYRLEIGSGKRPGCLSFISNVPALSASPEGPPSVTPRLKII